MDADARRHAPARDLRVDGVAHLRLEQLQLARQVHGDLRLPAVDRAQLDGDLETVPRAFAATVTRHGFHPAHYAKISRRKRINFQIRARPSEFKSIWTQRK